MIGEFLWIMITPSSILPLKKGGGGVGDEKIFAYPDWLLKFDNYKNIGRN